MMIRIGFGLPDAEAEESKEPDQPERRMQRRDDAAPVERHHRQQVEEVDEEAEERERLQRRASRGDPREVERERAGGAEQRAGDRELCLAPGVVRHLLERDQRAHEGMKTGADTGSPCRFASSTCPISWTNSNTTSPIPNHQPPIQT